VSTDRRNFDVSNVFKWVADACVLSQTSIVVVDRAWPIFVRVILDVFNDCAKADSVKNIWLFFSCKTITLGVAAALDVKDVILGPNVFIIAD